MASKKQKKIRVRHIITLVIALYIGSTFIKQQKIINKLNSEKEQKQQEITSLKNDIKSLEGKIQYTDSLEYIEKIAREELKMIKPDEIIYIDKDKNKDKFIKGIDD